MLYIDFFLVFRSMYFGEKGNGNFTKRFIYENLFISILIEK